MSKIVITGASGFIGKHLVDTLNAHHDVTALSRETPTDGTTKTQYTQVNYNDFDALCRLCRDADVVVHLADNPARLGTGIDRPTYVTETLIRAMQSAQVKKLIYTSSIYARKYEQDGMSQYGAHKVASENICASAEDITSIILRLPPVYGPGGKGGFSMLVKLLKSNLPLPVATAHAPRDYLSCPNLCDLVATLIAMDDTQWSALSAQKVEPSDGAPVTTAQLTESLQAMLQSKSIIFPFPQSIIKLCGKLVKKSDMVEGIFGALATQENPTFDQTVRWKPIEAMPESLEFLKEN